MLLDTVPMQYGGTQKPADGMRWFRVSFRMDAAAFAGLEPDAVSGFLAATFENYAGAWRRVDAVSAGWVTLEVQAKAEARV